MTETDVTFSVQKAKIGKGFLVIYHPPHAPQMEIRRTFDSETEAHKWILSAGSEWIDRLGQGR